MSKLTRLATKARVRGKSVRQVITRGLSTQQPRVILVSGVQRSGTNMLMDALERHWKTDVYHEYDSRAFDQYYMRDLATIEALHARSKARFFVIKALLEAHRLREIGDHFPGSKLVWMFRNYADMINSHMVSWPGFRERIDEIVVDPASAGFRGLGMSAQSLEFIRAHYRPDLNDASALALFWIYRNQLFFDQSLEEDPDSLVLRYEDIVTRPAPTLSKACERLGLPYSPGIHRHIHAKSISKRASPDIEAAIEGRCEAMLERLEAAAEREPLEVLAQQSAV